VWLCLKVTTSGPYTYSAVYECEYVYVYGYEYAYGCYPQEGVLRQSLSSAYPPF